MMATPEPREDPRPGRSRARLLDAATELLVEAGPSGVTVDAVAERSGVAKSTLYRHWRSRTDLLVDVIRCNMPDPGPPDAAADFETALRAWVRTGAVMLAAPGWARILPALMALQQHDPELHALVDADHAGKIAVLTEILERGVTEGRIGAAIDPVRAVQLLIGPLLFAVISGETDQLDALAEDVVDRFIASS